MFRFKRTQGEIRNSDADQSKYMFDNISTSIERKQKKKTLDHIKI